MHLACQFVQKVVLASGWKAEFNLKVSQILSVVAHSLRWYRREQMTPGAPDVDCPRTLVSKVARLSGCSLRYVEAILVVSFCRVSGMY